MRNDLCIFGDNKRITIGRMSFLKFLYAFLVGGGICLIGQLLIDRTSLTPARILTGFVAAGVLLTALGLYEPLVEFAGAGATVPISGFGYLMAEGVREAVARDGAFGILSGALTAGSGGICAAIIFSLIAGAISKPGDKS